jgi:hypothetical protein
LLESHTHCAPFPQAPVEPIEHVFVQKCVAGSPRLEHNGALEVEEQSLSDAQNLPTPRSLPVSPGKPQSESYASGLASTGFAALSFPPPVSPQATSINSSIAARMFFLPVSRSRYTRDASTISSSISKHRS